MNVQQDTRVNPVATSNSQFSKLSGNEACQIYGGNGTAGMANGFVGKDGLVRGPLGNVVGDKALTDLKKIQAASSSNFVATAWNYYFG